MKPKIYKAELIAKEDAALAESPIWDERTGTLIWADISSYAIWRTNTSTSHSEKHSLDQHIGCVAPYGDSGFVFAGENGFFELDEFGGTPSLINSAFNNDVEKLNDGKIDQHGNFWAGSGCLNGHESQGKLYCLDKKREVHEIFVGVTASNGFDWSPDGRYFYYVDTAVGGIDVFDVDEGNGALQNRRRLVDVSKSLGLADGLTVDMDGCIWLAIWYAGVVHRYSPNGNLIGKVTLPVCRASSCVFGGENMQTLFITTARGRKNSPHLTEEIAGGIFALETEFTGQRRSGYLG